MGIKDLLKNIDQEFPEERSREYDYFYLDSNYLIHYLIYKCNSDTDLYAKLYNYWNYLLSVVKIKKEILLVFDGEYDTEELANPKYQTHMLRAKAKKISDDYDKQSIYPGSKILNTFKNYLVDIIEKYKKINKLNFKISINGDDIKGEADTKILNGIYDNQQDNICICSKDSDMILIAHSLSLIKKINIDVLSNLRPIKFICLSALKKYGFDYVMFVLFLGNDYLPKISNVTYKNLIESYDEYIKFNDPVIQENKINQQNLIDFITTIITGTEKKIKFNFDNIDLERFDVYYNNLLWCLKHYKVIVNDNQYIQELENKNDKAKLRNVVNIYNFINYNDY
jgi:hypothetical protein